jgi:hypothetical protein
MDRRESVTPLEVHRLREDKNASEVRLEAEAEA